ncbi:MAG: GyrI-like domain-containing protein [Promethearchaeota archaeon]
MIKKVEPERITIINRGKPLRLLGCVFYGDPFHSVGGWSEENEIGLTWQRFMRLYEKHKAFIQQFCMKCEVMYEVHLEPEEYKNTKKFYVFTGIEITDSPEIPLELFNMTLPVSKYGIFTFKGENIFRGGEFIYNEWLPDSNYEEAHPFLIQAYDQRFKGMESSLLEESELDYHIPIKLKVY